MVASTAKKLRNKNYCHCVLGASSTGVVARTAISRLFVVNKLDALSGNAVHISRDYCWLDLTQCTRCKKCENLWIWHINVADQVLYQTSKGFTCPEGTLSNPAAPFDVWLQWEITWFTLRYTELSMHILSPKKLAMSAKKQASWWNALVCEHNNIDINRNRIGHCSRELIHSVQNLAANPCCNI